MGMTEVAQDDEQVLLVAHKHWASMLGEAALTVVPGLTILWLLILLRGLPLTLADASVHAVITLLVPFCFLTLWTILAIQWTNYYLEMFVVTDRHIFYTTQVNFTERTVSQWNIHDVSHATVHVGGLIESFFNYGSLTIEGREEYNAVTIGGIPDPEYVAAVILKQDDRYGELKETARKQRELLHFFSHEVKGHLAKSKAAFASIVEGDYGPLSSPLDTMAHAALADSQKGVDTVMSMLDNSNTESGEMRFEKKPFDLSLVAHRVAEEFRPRVERKGLMLLTSIDDACVLQGDEEKIERHVLRNLLENALRYTPVGHITLSLKKTEGGIRLSVADTGVGIEESDMQKLFTEGGHGEHSKEINADSTGFGLFVAKQVVEGNGGRIWVSSEGQGAGSTFFVEFPSTTS